MCKRFAALVFLTVALAVQARAWDRTGHMVVAYIAWQQMTPEARNALSNVLAFAPQRSDLLDLRPTSGEHAGMIHFIRASYWPDMVRNRDHAERYERYHRGSWHYTNIFWEEVGDDDYRIREDLQPPDVNIVERLYHLEQLARNDIVPKAQLAVYVAWLEHLVGDIHQPLHTSARVTPEEPEGDRGGNLFSLGEDDNLHWYWDRALTEAHEREVDESDVAFARRIGDDLMSAYPEPNEIAFEYESWAEEGFRIAVRDVYAEIERGQEPPLTYAEMAQRTAAEAIARAGYRLGSLMNDLFG